MVGSTAYAQLLPLCSFPFGSELAAFAGTLVTGMVTLGLNYFLLHSSEAPKYGCLSDPSCRMPVR